MRLHATCLLFLSLLPLATSSRAADRIDALLFPKPPADLAPRAAPSVLLRRLSLDLTGRLPDPSDAGVDALTDTLLASPAFAEHWGRVIRSWLTSGTTAFQPLASRSLARWLAIEIERDTPVDELVRELLSAQGSALDHPAVSYLLQMRDTREDLAGHAARTFLGARIQCAQCHDHPFAPWKQSDFRAFADLFGQVRVVQWPRPLIEAVLARGTVSPAEYMATMPAYVRNGWDPLESTCRHASLSIL